MKIILFANTDWYLYNFRLPLAEALRARGDEVIFLSPPGQYAPKLTKLGFRWLEFPFSRRGMNPLAELATVLRLWRLYWREQPDLVHHFTIKCVLYGSLAAHLSGIPRIINAITGLGYAFNKENHILGAIARFFYRFVLKNTKVIFQNPDDLDTFTNAKLLQPAQAHLIRSSGVDLARFPPRPETNNQPALVILPARLLKDKGVLEFVEAARLLKQRGIPTRMALIGDPDPYNPTSASPQEIHEWVAETIVEAWGWQEQMAEVYAASQIVCLPSYREGVPRTLLEAAASGRAIVATDAPGCREVVRHGVNGLLVPIRDPRALADAIQTLLENPGLRQQMGQRGREIVEQEFSSEIVIEKTIKVYERG
ncbi:MAG: glycosyltransferase family 4 protein [Anaerolineales bacterium]|jgi:glycosyltransferase involved in cell wall biosynthesis|nr:glycosyltransferase family 4 protein [Anaerolineales bacterium]